MYQYIYEGNCNKAEEILLEMLERIVHRNVEPGKDYGGDFSTVIHLEGWGNQDQFNKDFQTWLTLTRRPWKDSLKQNAENYLLACCTDKEKMGNLLNEIRSFLEGDYYLPHKELTRMLQEYKKIRS